MTGIKIEMPYGRGILTGNIPGKYKLEIMRPEKADCVDDLHRELLGALNNPIGEINLSGLHDAKKVAVVVNDTTRPVPTRQIMNSLLEWLQNFGITASRLVIMIGNGLHRSATKEEIDYLLPQEIISNSTIINHDAYDRDDLEEVGYTSRGTPVVINRFYIECDYRIVIGMIEPHQFVGFTGGAKGAVIGLSGAQTISGNHKMLIDKGACPGNIDGNPVREEIDEIGGIIGVDLILNVVLNREKKVVKAVAGHYLEAHREGVKIANAISRVYFDAPTDLVIASPGGYPKDANLYQAQKALYHAEMVVEKGGTVILVARLDEGIGDNLFEEKLGQFASPKAVLEDFYSNSFKIRTHKAYLWCRTLVKARTILVSADVKKDLLQIMKVDCVPSLQEALDMSLTSQAPGLKICLMPNALSVVPQLRSN